MKLFYKRDILVILAVLGLAALLWFFVWQSEAGAVVKVSLDGETVKTAPLHNNGEFTVGEIPGMVFAVENGQAFVARSDCPDKLCERMGRVSRAGQTVVCLPNRVVLTVEISVVDPNAPDMIAG